ncbi:MAG: hypothetical protein M5U34_38155 [Chloroflexi bacterium]|nr:hypothetical protein [Chloroflexota bacterium]
MEATETSRCHCCRNEGPRSTPTPIREERPLSTPTPTPTSTVTPPAVNKN